MPPDLPHRQRLLAVARLAGATVLGVVGQAAIDMPEGYFGAVDTISTAGLLYAWASVAAAAVLALGVLRGAVAVDWAVPLLYAINVGVFVPALASDPLIAGLVAIWNLTLLAQQVFPARDPDRASPPARPGDEEAWLDRVTPALRHLASVALVLTIAVVGYRLSRRPLTYGACLALNYGALVAATPALRRMIASGRRAVAAIALPAAASLPLLGSPSTALSWLAVSQLILLTALVARHQTTADVLHDFYDHPSRLIAASFATVVLLGTVLLTFPAASATGRAVNALDALFTATSATCVTGLIVLDTPHDFSLFGQAVILALIQVGGLGIMVLSTFATLLLGGSLGMRGERALSRMLEAPPGALAYRLTRFIVVATLVTEIAGAAVLFPVFRSAGDAPAEAVWRSVFHAVSAFCNAGFALQSDSLETLSGSPLALLAFAALIVFGGLGFAVLSGLWNRLALRRRKPVSVHVRVVLWVSAGLLVAGTLLHLALEWNGALAGETVAGKVLNAFFQSVTLRTAGFNSVPTAAMAPATILSMILFMGIGASPGSTGGGIKTTTFAVLWATLRGIVRRGEAPRLFDRAVPREIVDRSLAILVVSATAILGGLFALLVFEDQPFTALLFEVVSAFATVGLSLGATASLGPIGKLIIILLMFVGRIGPVTLALIVGSGSRGRRRASVPETRIMVG